MPNSISSKQEKLNTIYKLVNEMANESEEKLVRFCYSKGFTLTEIGNALGQTKQNLSNKYPDLKREVEA